MVLIVNNLLTVFIKQSFFAEKRGFTKLFRGRAAEKSSGAFRKSGEKTFSAELKQPDLSSKIRVRGFQMTDIETDKKN